MNYYNEVESLIRNNEINKGVLALQDNSWLCIPTGILIGL